ncbi:hypothetical protein A4D02_35665 [Niastella koreensis]|uniref:Response regulatory domain-containing protein n=1 Tax=Niastella koreensis TaxID=354356 RepID=A0ABX3NRW1_9BACT|nr:response regulator [Niastella koreensis]OQP44217.1 hypothetical protein A4D02_35665 [Niastella koreensis]
MTRKFLLVDDDLDDAKLFCEAIDQISSVECITIENGLKLFDLLSKHNINSSDVIFLDINMPVISGWECLKKLKSSAEYYRIPVIMYSTSSARNDIERAYNLGAQLFLTKPISFGELSNILEIVATSSQDSLLSQLKEFKSAKII